MNMSILSNTRCCTGQKHYWPSSVRVEESSQSGELVSNAVLPKSLELSMKQRMTAACSLRRFSVLAFIFSLPSPEWRRLGARITDRLLLSILFSALLEKERGAKLDPVGRLNKNKVERKWWTFKLIIGIGSDSKIPQGNVVDEVKKVTQDAEVPL